MTNFTDIYSDVTAPPFTLPPYGLFSVVPFTTPADPHWQAGIRWNDWNCLVAGGEAGDLCIAGITTEMTNKGRCPTYRHTKPFTVYMELLSDLSDSIVPDTERTLTQIEQRQVELHLWAEFHADAAWSAATSIDGGGDFAADALAALAYVELQLRQTSAGQGVIHMGVLAAALLSKELFPNGSRLLTRLGTPVVVGAGYGGTDYSDTVHIVGTGPMIAMRSTVFNSFGWNEEVNDQVNLSQRQYVIGWDCAVVVASIDTARGATGAGGGGAEGFLLTDGQTVFARNLVPGPPDDHGDPTVIAEDHLLDGAAYTPAGAVSIPTAGDVAHITPISQYLGSVAQADFGGDHWVWLVNGGGWTPDDAQTNATFILFWGDAAGITDYGLLHPLAVTNQQIIDHLVPTEPFIGKFLYVQETTHDGPIYAFKLYGSSDVVQSSADFGHSDPPAIAIAPVMVNFGQLTVDPDVTPYANPGLWYGTYPAGITFTYQWQKSTDGGTTWVDIAGETDASYTVTAEGAYQVLVSAHTAHGDSAPAPSNFVAVTFA